MTLLQYIFRQDEIKRWYKNHPVFCNLNVLNVKRNINLVLKKT